MASDRMLKCPKCRALASRVRERKLVTRFRRAEYMEQSGETLWVHDGRADESSLIATCGACAHEWCPRGVRTLEDLDGHRAERAP